MDKEEMNGFEYAAFRFSGALSGSAVRELIERGIITSYKEINLDGIKRIQERIEGSYVSDNLRTAVMGLFAYTDKIKRLSDGYAGIASEKGIRIIGEDNSLYPAKWKYLSGMPKVFFARGDLEALRKCEDKGSVAVVGSRKAGRYALFATSDFVERFTEGDLVTVSGMAKGVDREAHLASLKGGGTTIAILAGGPDNIYPPENGDIYDRICESGLVISEMPPGQVAVKSYFPARNRLISALSDCCCIMQAGLYSGTLHTASYAAAQGRDVFVLPNNVYNEDCIGGLLLLRDGAEVLIDPGTVVERVGESVRMRKLLEEDTEEEKDDDGWKEAICEELSERPLSARDLSILIPIPFSLLTAYISELEIDKRIRESRGKYVLTID